jgi:hypothetical protein
MIVCPVRYSQMKVQLTETSKRGEILKAETIEVESLTLPVVCYEYVSVGEYGYWCAVCTEDLSVVFITPFQGKLEISYVE